MFFAPPYFSKIKAESTATFDQNYVQTQDSAFGKSIGNFKRELE
jgi:hypothetical protein